MTQIVKEGKVNGSSKLNPNYAMGVTLLYHRLPSVLCHHIATARGNDYGSKALLEHLDGLVWKCIEDRKDSCSMIVIYQFYVMLIHRY